MATKEELKLQQEYNDALKISSSVTSGILRDVKEQVGLKTKLGKQLKSEISDLQSSDDIQKQIIKNEDRITQLSSVTAKNKVKRAQKDMESLKTMNKALAIESQMVDVIQKVNKEAQNLSDSLSSGLDGLVSDIKEVPVFGKVFGRFGDYASGILKNKIGAAASKFTTTFATNIRTMGLTGKGVMSSLGAAGSAAGGSLVAAFSGPQAIIAAIVIGIGAAVFAFYKLSEATKAFRQETGLLNSQTEGLEQKIINVTKTTALLGASTQDVAKAAAEFTNTFDGLQQPSEAVLGSIVTLNKNFGVGVTEATKLNKVFQNIGNLSADQSQALIGQTVQMATLAKVSPDKVIKDMADNSEYAYKYFGGSAEELSKAAVEAAKLGTSIGEAGKVADNLLDFEKSISSELEASAMLGQNLNFSRARQLAATKDVLGAQQAVVDEVMKLGDVTKLSSFEQEKLAEASGMTIESLSTQQKIRERFGRLDKEQLASALSLVEAGQDITKLSEADLKNQTKKLAEQKEMQSEFDNMKNQLSAVGMEFLMALAPIGKFVVGMLIPAFKILNVVIGGIGNAIAPIGDVIGDIFSSISPIISSLGGVIKIAFAPLTFVLSIIKNVYELFSSLVNDGLSGFVSKAQEIGPLMAGIATTVGIIATAFLVSIVPSIITFGTALISTVVPALITAVGSTITWAISMATAAIAAIASASALTLGIGALAIAGGIAVGAMAMKSGQESAQANVGSINDGVVQDGNIISTHPDDFLIATKNPAQLANQVGGGGGVPMISMDGVIAELRELKAAFLSNKDVYMDSTKVTTIVRRKTETSTDNKFGTQFA